MVSGSGPVIAASVGPVTRDLPPLSYRVPDSLDAILSTGGSLAGKSARELYLSCPERSRLKSLGLKPREGQRIIQGKKDLKALGLGSVFHALRATRYVHGMVKALDLLQSIYEELTQDDALKLFHWIKLYDERYPIEEEPFEILGVETEVITDIGGRVKGSSCFVSVRYDAIVRDLKTREILSHELKTSARGGMAVMNPYRSQLYTHCLVWNSNPWLVEKYGRMTNVIGDVVVKTKVPGFERYPFYVSDFQQELSRRWLRLPEIIYFPKNEDGSFPQMLQSCWGRFAPCEFVNLCHEGETGNFEMPDEGEDED